MNFFPTGEWNKGMETTYSARNDSPQSPIYHAHSMTSNSVLQRDLL